MFLDKCGFKQVDELLLVEKEKLKDAVKTKSYGIPK